MPTKMTRIRPGEPTGALLALSRGRLRPYRGGLAALLAVQAVQSLAMLLLPTLYANVVDHGVLAHDTGYTLGHGVLMLAVTVVQVSCAACGVWLGARVAMGL